MSGPLVPTLTSRPVTTLTAKMFMKMKHDIFSQENLEITNM